MCDGANVGIMMGMAERLKALEIFQESFMKPETGIMAQINTSLSILSDRIDALVPADTGGMMQVPNLRPGASVDGRIVESMREELGQLRGLMRREGAAVPDSPPASGGRDV
jgi:hypothetical protein